MATKHNNIYEFMHNLPVEGLASGVDALTITATGESGKLSISLVIHSLKCYLDVEEQKPFRFIRATGWQRGSVSYAEEVRQGKKLWCILMVRGKIAEEAFQTALLLDNIKYTRVDCCVDIMLTERVPKLTRRLKDTYKGSFEPVLIESLTGDTLYVGSRESDIYIRIYDKSMEYGRQLGTVWRFEVEFKGTKAPVVANRLKVDGLAISKDIVWTALRSRDLPTPVIGTTVDIRGQLVTVSSAEMKLAWLGRQVRPTVKFLTSLGMKDEVYEQLGLIE